MHLKRLELSGFKSFAKKSVLDFNSRITSIVGPNGSGKSNIAEAFRFVLGEQSLKSMRGKKGEDMIFNGSSSMGRPNRASVKVVFDNIGKMLNVDFDEVALERVVHRDGINEYFVNGTQVRLKDIVELLAGAHIGATGHHIISQGEADKILNSNIRERREMLDDALGLKIYEYKKKESEAKLEKTEENVKSVESLRRELSPRLKFLEKQVEKVEKARQMKIELGQLYREYFYDEDLYIADQKKLLADAKKPPAEELKMLEKKLREQKKILEESGKGGSRGNSLMHLEERIKKARDERESLNRNLGRIEGEIDAIKRNMERSARMAGANGVSTVPLTDLEGIYERMRELFDEGEGSENPSVTKSVLRRVREIIVGFITAAKNKKDIPIEQSADISRLGDEKKKAEERILVLKAEEGSAEEEYLKIKDDIDKEKAGSVEAEKNMLRIMARQREIVSDLSAIRANEDRLAVEEEDFKRELYEAGMLAGRAALDYKNSGGDTSQDQCPSSKEQRQKQHDRMKQIERIKIRLEESGTGGEDIIKEFTEAKERDVFLAKELQDLAASAENLGGLIADMETKLDVEFKEGVAKINEKFQEFFSIMFGGGEASLMVVKEQRRKKKGLLEELENDELGGENFEEASAEGIEINVSLPRKKIKGLVMLSGGERALASIALLFAMSQVNPPPFIILDETDAALDEANSKKYGDMIESLAKVSQLILITHNRETMGRASILYWVTMGSDGISKLLSVKFEEAVAVAK